jgi:hypothetical protein
MNENRLQVVQAEDPFNTEAELAYLGFGEKKEAEAPAPQEPVKKDETVTKPTEEAAPKEEVVQPRKSTKEVLDEALGKKVKVDPKDEEKEVLKKKLADSETRIRINEESTALITLLSQMPKDEVDILGPAVEELVASDEYKSLEGQDAMKKAANLITKARGLNFDALVALKGNQPKETDGKVREVYEKIASGGPTRAAIDDPNKKLVELQQAAAMGDRRAQDMLIEMSIDEGPEGDWIKKKYGA